MVRRCFQFALLGLCPVVIAAGSWLLSDHSFRPGAQGNVPTELNLHDSQIANLVADNSDSLKLFVFYHPHCPCTGANTRNLDQLIPTFSRDVKIIAFAFCPKAEPATWIESRLTDSFRRIRAEVIVDFDANQCSSFGARTSGHMLLYGSNDSLLFSGGITPGRDHEGSCAATADLVRKINGLPKTAGHWPVYGCPIFGPKSEN